MEGQQETPPSISMVIETPDILSSNHSQMVSGSEMLQNINNSVSNLPLESNLNQIRFEDFNIPANLVFAVGNENITENKPYTFHASRSKHMSQMNPRPNRWLKGQKLYIMRTIKATPQSHTRNLLKQHLHFGTIGGISCAYFDIDEAIGIPQSAGGDGAAREYGMRKYIRMGFIKSTKHSVFISRGKFVDHGPFDALFVGKDNWFSDSVACVTSSEMVIEKNPGPECWNCGGKHLLPDCPLPKDRKKINASRSKAKSAPKDCVCFNCGYNDHNTVNCRKPAISQEAMQANLQKYKKSTSVQKVVKSSKNAIVNKAMIADIQTQQGHIDALKEIIADQKDEIADLAIGDINIISPNLPEGPGPKVPPEEPEEEPEQDFEIDYSTWKFSYNLPNREYAYVGISAHWGIWIYVIWTALFLFTILPSPCKVIYETDILNFPESNWNLVFQPNCKAGCNSNSYLYHPLFINKDTVLKYHYIFEFMDILHNLDMIYFVTLSLVAILIAYTSAYAFQFEEYFERIDRKCSKIRIRVVETIVSPFKQDMRPDSHRTGKAKHNDPRLAKVEIHFWENGSFDDYINMKYMEKERSWLVSFYVFMKFADTGITNCVFSIMTGLFRLPKLIPLRKKQVLLVSMEALSQFVSSEKILVSSSMTDAQLRIERCLRSLGTVNYNRYHFLENEDLLGNTSIVALHWAKFNKLRRQELYQYLN